MTRVQVFFSAFFGFSGPHLMEGIIQERAQRGEKGGGREGGSEGGRVGGSDREGNCVLSLFN